MLRCLHKWLFALSLMVTGTAAHAQLALSGKVLNAETQEPLVGASVVELGTNNGAFTNERGEFSLQVKGADARLFVSMLGFERQEFALEGRTTFSVAMVPKITSLDEVVVVGYGTQRKADLTGSVAVVDVKEIRKISTNDLSQQLQGRVAGVRVTSDGQPGAIPNVRIRGISTFGDAQPLYVIDGIPIQGVPRDFNPNDIETMQVLKDASASAIYGSRAANGVVIITTRQGTKNQPLDVSYSGHYGVDQVWQRIPVADAEVYKQLHAEVRANGGTSPVVVPGYDPNSPFYVGDVNTDWQEAGIKNGNRQNHNVQFSGGGANTTYLMSLDYFNQNGTYVGNGPDYERITTRINTTAERGRFKVGTNLFYTKSHENTLTFRDDILFGGVAPLVNTLVMAIPTQQIYDENNLGGFGGTEENIHDAISLNAIGVNSMFTNYVDVDKVYATGFGELNLIKRNGHDLSYRVNIGLESTHTRDHSFAPAFDLGYFYYSDIARLDETHRIFGNFVLENILTYKKKFGKHGIDLTAGYTYQERSFKSIFAGANEFTTPYYPILSNGGVPEVGQYEEYNYLSSYLGRLNYNFDDRFLVTLTMRRDGSSKFGDLSRFGYFPAASVAWRLANEPWWNVNPNVVGDIKIRASYGVLGNENIAPYLYLTGVNRNIIYNFGDERVIGSIQTTIVDESIKWEELTTSNLAVDLVLFNGRIDATVEVFDRTTADILLGVPIPASSGSINLAPTVNAGSINNKGIELQAVVHGKKGKLNFDIGANYSYMVNEVRALANQVEFVYGAGSRTEVGQPIAQHYGWDFMGIFQTQEEIDNHAFQDANTAPGDAIFRDIDGNDTINDADRMYLGSGVPKHYFGFNLSMNHGNFDFSLFAAGAAGYLINSGLYRTMMHTSGYHNWHTDIYDRWTPNNTDTDIPRLVDNDPNNNNRDSDRPGWLQNGAHLRLATIQLGYTLPSNDFFNQFIRSARLYVTLQNFYTFQSYKSYNPDYSAGVFSQGFDFGSYPRPRTSLFGLDVKF